MRIPPATHRDIANLAAEAGISINAFVKKALCDAVRKPWVEPGSLVREYSYEEPEPAMVMEPSVKYGATDTVKLTIPQKDIAFAKELFARFGWDFE